MNQYSTYIYAVCICCILYLQDADAISCWQEGVPRHGPDSAIDGVQHLLNAAHQQHFHAAAAVHRICLLLQVLLTALLPL